MSGPRAYHAGTERALYLLSRGSCYFPECPERVITFVGDIPIANVQITHIRGALSGSPRYDPTMTDAERAAFTNLILTCKPHHDLIDRIQPELFPVDLLLEWKVAREDDSIKVLRGLADLTEARLAELLERAFRANATGQREVIVDLRGAIFVSGVNALTIPIEAWRTTLDANPVLRGGAQALVVSIRNVGYVNASVESIELNFIYDGNEGEPISLLGQNEFPFLNPQLPARLEAGSPAIKWLFSLGSVRLCATAAAQVVKTGTIRLRATVVLGSGEKVSSETHDVTELPAASA